MPLFLQFRPFHRGFRVVFSLCALFTLGLDDNERERERGFFGGTSHLPSRTYLVGNTGYSRFFNQRHVSKEEEEEEGEGEGEEEAFSIKDL